MEAVKEALEGHGAILMDQCNVLMELSLHLMAPHLKILLPNSLKWALLNLFQDEEVPGALTSTQMAPSKVLVESVIRLKASCLMAFHQGSLNLE